MGEQLQSGYLATMARNLALRRENTYGKSYELCTNALVEQTFRANGYAALARKVETGERPVVPADVRYVLFLRSTQVRFLSNPQGTAASPFPGVLIDVEGDLLDRKTGKRLWTVYNWLASDAKKNSVPSVHLVRALAADGYLKIKPNEVVDYLGGRAKSEDDIATGCP